MPSATALSVVRSMGPARQNTNMSMRKLSEAQRGMALLIYDLFRQAGFSDRVAKAAIVNAYAESDLNPAAIGDGGESVGLFQLYSGGAGKGMSVSERKDPVANTMRIIEETRADGAPVLAAWTVPTAAVAFGRFVERHHGSSNPLNPESARRYRIAMELFPSPWDTMPMREFAIGAAVVALGAGTYYYMR